MSFKMLNIIFNKFFFHLHEIAIVLIEMIFFSNWFYLFCLEMDLSNVPLYDKFTIVLFDFFWHCLSVKNNWPFESVTRKWNIFITQWIHHLWIEWEPCISDWSCITYIQVYAWPSICVIDCVWRFSYSAMFVICFLFVVIIIYILSRLMVERLQ